MQYDPFITTDVINMLKNENTHIARAVLKSLEYWYNRNDCEIITHNNIWYVKGYMAIYVERYLKDFLNSKMNLTHISETFFQSTTS